MSHRTETARAAADRLDGIVETRRAVVGFDGFIDSIVHLVSRRTGMGPSQYERIRTIPEFAARCLAAAGKSTNIEQVLVEDRFGGNGPLLAGGLAALGMPTTFVGAVGAAGAPSGERGAVHPVFQPFAARCERVVPIGVPSYTLCMEFDDGKLMINNTAQVQECTWQRVREAVGVSTLRGWIDGASLIGVVNWSLLGGVPGILDGLHHEVLERLDAKPRRLMIDLSDPAKRTDGDIRMVLDQLARLEEVPGVSVTLGLNWSEAERLALVLGVDLMSTASLGGRVEQAAVGLRRAVGLDCVVVHPREGAGGATASGDSAWFVGPLTRSPKLSTGAGDHFNAGVAFAQAHDFGLLESLAVGCAVSGAYVRDGASPGRQRTAAFLRDLPLPEAP